MKKRSIALIVMVAMVVLAAFSIIPVIAPGNPGAGCTSETEFYDTIHGGIYFEQQGWMQKPTMTKTFVDIPDGIKIARVYTGVWQGSPGKGGKFNITITNATDSYTTSTYQACDPCPSAPCAASQSLRCDALNWTGNVPPNVPSGDIHDYLVGCGVHFVSFNATPYITPGSNTITVETSCDSCTCWDGRMYLIALLVVYENSSMPEITYWINEGAPYMEKGSGCDGPEDHLEASFYFNGTHLDNPEKVTYSVLGWPRVFNACEGAAYTKLNDNSIGCPDYSEAYGGYEVFVRYDDIPTGWLDLNSNFVEYYDDAPVYERAFAAWLVVQGQEEVPTLAIYVNESGWWCDGGAFNPSGTPIQDAVDNATVCCGTFTCENPCTIRVKDGIYNENVDVATANLTIQSENGSAVTTVTAADSSSPVFKVNNVDCVNINGFTVNGATGSYGYGIYVYKAEHCNISYNNATGNKRGIYLFGTTSDPTKYNMLMNNIANSNSGHGIYLYKSCSYNTLANNIANSNTYKDSTDPGYGIRLRTSGSYLCNNNNLINNTANLNAEHGIYLSKSSNNNLTTNIAASNTKRGIYLYDSSNNNSLTGNIANSNEWEGIYLESSSRNNLTGNIANSNTLDGFHLHTISNYNNFSNNAANDNKQHGFYLSGSHHSEITNKSAGNTVNNNSKCGFYLSDADENEITCNLVADNDECGFYLLAGSTGNNISHNNIIANGVYNATSSGWEWNFHNAQSDDVNAADNYWRTAVSAEIAASIWKDTGTVDYEPFLSNPAPCAPEPHIEEVVPPTPLLINGYVNYDNGDPVNNPNVTITNLNTTEVFIAETFSGWNYYQNSTDSDRVSAGHVLHFNASDGAGNSAELNHTVTEEEMNMGLLMQDIIIEKPVEEMPDLLVTDINAYHNNTGCPAWFNLSNEIDVTVKNDGTGTTGASNVCLYIEDVFFGKLSVSSLSAGASETVTFENWMPIGEDCLLPPCDFELLAKYYNFTAVADCDGVVSESNETNNETTVVDKACYNGYMADEPLENVAHGKLHGHMIYTTGDGVYSSLYSVGDTQVTNYDITIPAGASVKVANLNVYYTWCKPQGTCPEMEVSIQNGTGTYVLPLEKAYNDVKCTCPGASWILMWGNYVYDVADYIDGSGTYTVTVKNVCTVCQYFCPAAPGIVLVYEDANAPMIEYWINKGADVLMGGRRYATSSNLAWWENINNATFTASSETSEVVNATLGVVSPWGGSAWAPGMTNYLFFNDIKLGTGVYHGYGEKYKETIDSITMEVNSTNAQVGVNVSDVTALYLQGSDNVVGQADDGDNMMPSNAFLVVEYEEVVPPMPDLNVTSITINPNCTNAHEIFANESNGIRAEIKNEGDANATAFNVSFVVDGYSEEVRISGLAAGASTTEGINDPTLRNAGASVTITVTADCNGEVAESDETNNASSIAKTVVNNGYKGKRYTGGEDLETIQTHTLNGNLLYSLGDSYYASGYAGWTKYNASWTASDLPVPGTATIEEARLYVIYNWDRNVAMPGIVSISFNGIAQTWDKHYSDRKSFGKYDYPYGTLAYDVTGDFSTSGNIANLTNSETGKTVSMRGMLLVVIYADDSEPKRKIIMNEEFDLLYGGSSYCTTPEEATAYAPLGAIDLTGMEKATLITFAPGAGPNEGDLLFNGQIWYDVWNFVGTGSPTPQIGINETDVTLYLNATENEAGFQSSADYMEASNAFLVVEYEVVEEKPDLVITEKSEELLEDGTFTVTYTVKNIGEGDAGASNTTIFIDGTAVMEDPVPALAAGETYTNTVGPFDCPCGETLTIEVCADNENVVAESDEENNCMENELECPGIPDLVVEKSVTFDEDGNFIVSYTVTNQGCGPAGESTTCKFVDGELKESQTCPALGSGESYSGTFEPEPCPCGETLNVTVCADNDDVIAESDETNNCEVNVVECRPVPVIPVDVDVKPGSCPNPLNLKSKGVLPVAVLGTAEFDVTTIDPGTIQLNRSCEGCVGVAPIRWSYEDVATPFTGELCDCHDLNGDGYIDLTLKFDTQELVSSLKLDNVAGETIPLALTGNLKAESGGTPIEGKDCIRVK